GDHRGVVVLGDLGDRQRVGAGDGADDHIHLVLAAVLGRHLGGLIRLGCVVIPDRLDLAAEDAARRIDLVHRHQRAAVAGGAEGGDVAGFLEVESDLDRAFLATTAGTAGASTGGAATT